MSEVEFSDEEADARAIKQRARARSGSVRSSPRFINLLIRFRLAKDERGAAFLLLGVAVLAALSAVVIFLLATR